MFLFFYILLKYIFMYWLIQAEKEVEKEWIFIVLPSYSKLHLAPIQMNAKQLKRASIRYYYWFQLVSIFFPIDFIPQFKLNYDWLLNGWLIDCWLELWSVAVIDCFRHSIWCLIPFSQILWVPTPMVCQRVWGHSGVPGEWIESRSSILIYLF